MDREVDCSHVPPLATSSLPYMSVYTECSSCASGARAHGMHHQIFVLHGHECVSTPWSAPMQQRLLQFGPFHVLSFLAYTYTVASFVHEKRPRPRPNLGKSEGRSPRGFRRK